MGISHFKAPRIVARTILVICGIFSALAPSSASSFPEDPRTAEEWLRRYSEGALKITTISARSGELEITAQGAVGFACKLEGSADLREWSELDSDDRLTGRFQFNLPIPANLNFFRLSQVESDGRPIVAPESISEMYSGHHTVELYPFSGQPYRLEVEVESGLKKDNNWSFITTTTPGYESQPPGDCDGCPTYMMLAFDTPKSGTFIRETPSAVIEGFFHLSNEPGTKPFLAPTDFHQFTNEVTFKLTSLHGTGELRFNGESDFAYEASGDHDPFPRRGSVVSTNRFGYGWTVFLKIGVGGLDAHLVFNLETWNSGNFEFAGPPGEINGSFIIESSGVGGLAPKSVAGATLHLDGTQADETFTFLSNAEFSSGEALGGAYMYNSVPNGNKANLSAYFNSPEGNSDEYSVALTFLDEISGNFFAERLVDGEESTLFGTFSLAK